MKVRAFITHKPAEKFEDCQDSFAISRENKAIAIADGVSQSMFPKKWADLLTKAFVDDGSFTLDATEKIEDLRTRWRQFFAEELQRQKEAKTPTVWLTENAFNANLSAGATLAGIRIAKGEKGEQVVNYEVLGDSCIIAVKDGIIKKQISSKPEGAEFDNYPDYIDSNSTIGQKGESCKGEISYSDCEQILMVTDALSDLFNKVRHDDRGKALIEEVNKLSNHEEFEAFVRRRRANGMSHDDTTLVIIELDENPDFESLYQTPLKNLIEDEKKKIEEDIFKKTRERLRESFIEWLFNLFRKELQAKVASNENEVTAFIEKYRERILDEILEALIEKYERNR
jgi:hypothetical protein